MKLKSKKFPSIVIALLTIILFSSLLTSCNETTQPAMAAMATKSIPKERNTPPPTDTTAQKILLIGDSMAYTLVYRLEEYCAQNNHTMEAVSWVSSSTKWFGETDTLAYFIKKFAPTFVIFVIGSNELFVDHIAQRRDLDMDRIKAQTKGVRMVWVGPPNWKEDSGINDLILSKAGKGKFFLSKYLKLERRDGAHPTHQAASIWMDSIASWITHKSVYPIKLDYPKVKSSIKYNPIVLKPLYTDPIDSTKLKQKKNDTIKEAKMN